MVQWYYDCVNNASRFPVNTTHVVLEHARRWCRAQLIELKTPYQNRNEYFCSKPTSSPPPPP